MSEYSNNTVLAEGRHLRLVVQNGWEFVERTVGDGVVAIVAVTDTGCLIVIEQFRTPVGQPIIELPAGLCGDDAADHDAAAAATRELLEETGYQAGSMTLLTRGPTSAGQSSEIVEIFLARDLRKVQPGGGIDDEQIIVHEVPVDSCPMWLQRRAAAGALIDAKVYAALHFVAAGAGGS